MPMIYLDHNATTPLDPRVLDAMLPFFTDRFGNAASRHHALGCDAATAVETAREQVAAVIGADPREIVWTSGATESDNLALQGVARAPAYAKKRHVVTVTTEHRAVLDTCEHLEGQGVRVTYLRVDGDGRLDLDRLAEAITEKTLLVSVMHANNETGVLHPIARIGALCRERGVLFHTDATQSWGKERIDVNAMHVDLLSASAHKIHGPKGVGMLFVRRRGPRVRCEPMVHGGGHERGLRSGTLNVPGIVGMGVAATLAAEDGAARAPCATGWNPAAVPVGRRRGERPPCRAPREHHEPQLRGGGRGEADEADAGAGGVVELRLHQRRPPAQLRPRRDGLRRRPHPRQRALLAGPVQHRRRDRDRHRDRRRGRGGAAGGTGLRLVIGWRLRWLGSTRGGRTVPKPDSCTGLRAAARKARPTALTRPRTEEAAAWSETVAGTR